MTKKTSVLIALSLIAIGVLSRLLPHAWNTTPITAIALFSAAYLGFRYSIAITMGAMAVSDIFIGFYQWEIMSSVYIGFAFAGAIGLLIQKRKTAPVILMGTMTSSLIFFIVTNFAVWQWSGMYDRTFSGLIECFTLALPFFKNAFLGDIAYATILFGTYEFAYRLSLKRTDSLIVTSDINLPS